MTYLDLVEKLNDWAYRYYVLDEPIVSDSEYDALYDELVRTEAETGLVAPDSPSRRVGGAPVKAFGTHRHLSRLYSLDKAQSIEALRAWYRRIEGLLQLSPIITLEPKLDGLTLCLTYEGGKFLRATTRGDGVEGEDVTEQVLTIKSVPLRILDTSTVEVQGEGVMRLSKFAAYNKTAKEPLKNPRNGVAGAIRNLNPKVTAERNLDVYFYNVNYSDERDFFTQTEMLEWLRVQKFPTVPCARYGSIEECVAAVEATDRDKFDYLIDGMVVKVDEQKYRDELGATDKFPRWAVAYKFAAVETSTTLERVEWNVGRTGKVTPLAVLEAVELCGATVTRATLNNLSDIRRKNVAVGDRVFVRRSNDVIPEIMGLAERGAVPQEITAPEACPGCGKALSEIGAHLYCTNPECPPQIIAGLEYFCGKDCLDIAGISTATATQMYHELKVLSPVGLFSLEKEDLLRLDGVKDKKANNILGAINAAKSVSLAKFIMALGIPGIGKKTASDLAERFQNIDRLLAAPEEELLAVHEIGDILAENIRTFFATHRDFVEQLRSVMTITYVEKAGHLAGKTFVLTGTLEGMSRSEAAKRIEAAGGTTASGISKTVDYVIVGADAGSKLEKAQKLGLRILDRTEFLELLELTFEA